MRFRFSGLSAKRQVIEEAVRVVDHAGDLWIFRWLRQVALREHLVAGVDGGEHHQQPVLVDHVVTVDAQLHVVPGGVLEDLEPDDPLDWRLGTGSDPDVVVARHPEDAAADILQVVGGHAPRRLLWEVEAVALEALVVRAPVRRLGHRLDCGYFGLHSNLVFNYKAKREWVVNYLKSGPVKSLAEDKYQSTLKLQIDFCA